MVERVPIAAKIIGRDLPGRRCAGRGDVHLGLQRGREVVGIVPGDVTAARFDLTLDVIVGDDGGADDFRGPYVQGARGARFLYLSWGQIGEDSAFVMFGRVKLPLPALDAPALARLKMGTTPLTALAGLSDAHGRPVTATLRAPQLVWEW